MPSGLQGGGYRCCRLSNSTIRSDVNGRVISAIPDASATALAMQTGVLIAFPSATPWRRAASPATGSLDAGSRSGWHGIISESAGQETAVMPWAASISSTIRRLNGN